MVEKPPSAGAQPMASLAGQLLLAMPGIGDERFDRAVIAVCSHDEEGALGIGVGAVVPGLGLRTLLEQCAIDPAAAPDLPVHRGGPVEPQRGFVLHSLDWTSEATLEIATGEAGAAWGLTGTLDILRAIAAGRGPARALVALGYAGWSAHQLDREMTRHGWFAVPADEALVFAGDPGTRWDAAFASAGIDVRLLSAAPGHA